MMLCCAPACWFLMPCCMDYLLKNINNGAGVDAAGHGKYYFGAVSHGRCGPMRI